ncbi:cysteine peptidase C (CPC) [Trypanosoma grayi]|uniref:cysteine peptidase C (CPC) n=1 Tax=Trypanosoma grayi TaxID=71804 RepID=UPI0004F4186B|nr:cysteine peptidase C (CPC) [Trypanosoma grayi]KEG08551.1 cysteine peptidase C (CPC) [Trypanosoma grayi]
MRTGIATSLIALLLLVATAHALHVEDAPIVTRKFVDHINRLNGGLWTASYTRGMKHMTTRKAMRLMGALRKSTSTLPMRSFSKEELRVQLPDSFEAAEKWPRCPTITEIRDQSDCGSCWAVGAASAMSDRYCTIGGVRDVRISAGDLMSCCSACGFGCNGGYPDEAWSYFVEMGIVSEYCQPYPFPACAHHVNSSVYPPCPSGSDETPSCNATCTDKTIPLIKYKGNSSYTVKGEEGYKRELYLRGPFEVAFNVFEDFMAYQSGVYKHVAGGLLGGHAVRIVGWGELNGTPYWKIANSWNDGWGMNGYFLIARGKNECDVERSGSAGTPSIPVV